MHVAHIIRERRKYENLIETATLSQQTFIKYNKFRLFTFTIFAKESTLQSIGEIEAFQTVIHELNLKQSLKWAEVLLNKTNNQDY